MSHQEKRKEFDMELEGDIRLPKAINIRELVNARIQEIEALSEAIENPQRTGMIFQQLPKKMRRRVMSHNAKRMPSKLKQAHQALLDKCGATDVGKRPSRKFRRRPRNLREEYVRRQRTNVWLETHIWHAKRFHMINMWGYRIPNYPNDKSFRACYRASSQHCLLQDVSYLCCIELTGNQNDILSYLNNFSSDSFKRISELGGEREGESLFVCPTSKQPIGQVKFMWRSDDVESSRRQIWMWCHPAFYTELYDVLNRPEYISDNISIKSLKDQVLRFSLTGPKCLDVLSGAFKFYDRKYLSSSWASQYYNDPVRLTRLDIQKEYYNKMTKLCEAGLLPARSISPVLIRTSLPALPQPLRHRDIDTDMVIEKPVGEVSSPLWDEGMRDLMKQANILSKKEHKNKLIACDSPRDDTPVSLIIIQRPGRQTDSFIGYGSGVDIICPCGWGMRVWLCLVHNGGRACGLRDSNIVQTEISNRPCFPRLSHSYENYQKTTELSNRDRYFRLPPAKRPNFQTFGIINPFDIPWKQLQTEWNQSNLIRVVIEISGKGILTGSSPIYLPLISDLSDKNSPVEPKHRDPNKKERKLLNETHRIELRKIAKKRKKLRSTGVTELPSSKEIVDKHKTVMEELWLGRVDNVRNYNCREIIGFITEGGYSYLKGKCSGFGYVTEEGLHALNKLTPANNNNVVFIRNINSFQYRFANLIKV